MDARESGQNDYGRFQFRRTDALQFKLQRDIVIRDDEISRLKTDLALIRGQADTFKQPDKPLENQRMELNRKVFEARSQFETRRSRIQNEHQQALQELESEHEAERQKLEKRMNSVLFESNRPAPIDAIDSFLGGMRSPRPKGDAAVGRKKRRDAIRSEISGIESKTRDAASQLDELNGQLRNSRKKLQALKSSEPIVVPEIFSAVDFTAEIGRAREATQTVIAQLDQERQAAIDRCRVAESGISAMRDELSALAKAQAKAEAGLAEAERQKKLLTKKTQQSPFPPNGSPQTRVPSLTERRSRIQGLLHEEKRLKKEIARLDFMVYGRAGKYQEWKHLQ